MLLMLLLIPVLFFNQISCLCFISQKAAQKADKAATAQARQKAFDLCDKAEKLIIHHQWIEAQKNVDQAFALKADNAYAWFVQGIIEEQHGKDLKLAIADFDKSAAYFPNNYCVYFHRASVHHALNQLDAAIADYTKAISINPTDDRVYTWRANCYVMQGKLKLAVADLSKALVLKPNDLDALDGRANVYYMMYEDSLAVADSQKLVALYPKNHSGYEILSLIYYYQRKDTLALKNIKALKAIDPQNPTAATLLSYLEPVPTHSVKSTKVHHHPV